MSSRAHAPAGYRLRPGPRRQGSRASRIHWDRLGRVVLVLALGTILLLYVNPIANFIDAYRDAGAERAKLQELHAENAELRRSAAALEGPDAAERAARELGMILEGERGYVIRGLPKD